MQSVIIELNRLKCPLRPSYLYYNGLTRVNVTGGVALELSVVIQNPSVSWTFFTSVCSLLLFASHRLRIKVNYWNVWSLLKMFSQMSSALLVSLSHWAGPSLMVRGCTTRPRLADVTPTGWTAPSPSTSAQPVPGWSSSARKSTWGVETKSPFRTRVKLKGRETLCTTGWEVRAIIIQDHWETLRNPHPLQRESESQV